MKRGLDWYKREPRAIRDAIRERKMSAVQACVYQLVIDLIYEGGGETPNDPAYFAAHFSDISATKARRAVDDLLAWGKLFLVGNMLHQPRAENEAKTRADLSQKRAEAGRLGGISSGKARAKPAARPNESNNLTEANASSKPEAEKRREEIEGGGGGGAREPADFYDRVLAAAKVDTTREASAKWFSSENRWAIDRWRESGLSEAEILTEIESVMRGRRGPPNGLAYFNPAMERATGRKLAPPLTPQIPTDGAFHDRRPTARTRIEADVDAWIAGASRIP